MGAKLRDWLEFEPDRWQVGTVRVDQLLPAHSPRSAGEDQEHIRRLAESVTPLPPIVAHRPTMRVIDGMHRLRAAIMRGQSEIAVRWYDGDERDIFAIAVHANVAHGLPLSMTDRRAAATRLMCSHRHWSDRMIADVVNMSPATVHSIRTGVAGLAGASDVRLGRDGRVRPLNSAEARRLAGDLLLAKPDSSLREVARATGLAPSTVLDVRRRLQAGKDPVPAKHRARASSSRSSANHTARTVSNRQADGHPVNLIDLNAAVRSLRNDPALRYNNVGRTLLTWLNSGPTEPEERMRVANQLPAHCLDAIATVAQNQAAAWQQLVDVLETRRCRLG